MIIEKRFIECKGADGGVPESRVGAERGHSLNIFNDAVGLCGVLIQQGVGGIRTYFNLVSQFNDIPDDPGLAGNNIFIVVGRRFKYGSILCAERVFAGIKKAGATTGLPTGWSQAYSFLGD